MRLYTAKTLQATLQLIGETFGPNKTVSIPLAQAYHRVLAQSITAQEDVPAFNRSTVDGYGVLCQNTFGASQGIPAFLTLAGQVDMGEAAMQLPPEGAVYTPTGGMVPPGADGVVMIEDTQLLDHTLNIYKQIAPQENIIQQGEDCHMGEALLPKGRRIQSGEMGILASLGYETIPVYCQPRVALLSTGDELLPWTTPHLPKGKIRDCNAPALLGLCQRFGAQATYLGICPDDYQTLKQQAQNALKNCEILVLSGGSSVGAKDYTAKLLAELGKDQLLVEGLAIQPGKPTLLGNYENKALLGLPGHPLSALNVFSFLGKALIQAFSGQKTSDLPTPTIQAKLTENVPSQPGRLDVIRVRFSKDQEGQLWATPVLGRSALLKSLRIAQGVLLVPEELEGFPANSLVQVALLD